MTQTSSPQLAASDLDSASLASRAGACLLDALWVAVPTVLLFLILSSVAAEAERTGEATRAMGVWLAAWLGSGVLGVLSFACWAALLGRGSTPGLNALGLRLVRVGEGGYVDAPGFGRALVRAVVFTLGACIVVGPFSPLFDRTGARRGWHDTLSGTRVTLATADATTSEPEADWLPVEHLAPPRVPGRPAASVGPSASVPVALSFVPKGRATYTAPLEARPQYPFTRPAADHDDFDLDRTRSADAVALPSTLGAVRWVLRLDTGEAFDVHGDGLIGRDPVAPEGGSCQLIGYADTTMSISKTHLSFGVEGGRLWMTDRRSTNGSSLIRAGSAQRPISTVVRTFVEPGDLIALGVRRIWVATR